MNSITDVTRCSLGGRADSSVSLHVYAVRASALQRSVFFFFQAEDGIRDYKVTGVQTCALPISSFAATSSPAGKPPAKTHRNGFERGLARGRFRGWRGRRLRVLCRKNRSARPGRDRKSVV